MPNRRRVQRGANMPPAPRPRRMPRGRGQQLGRNTGRLEANQANLIVQYRELWSPVGPGLPAGSAPAALVFTPGLSGLPQLDALAALYESYRILGKVKVEFRTAAGSVNNGSFIMGVDYDARDTIPGYAGAAALVPKAVGPITQNSILHVDHNRAMNKKWLFSNSPGGPGEAAFAIVYSTTSPTTLGNPGDIWCEYHVEFISPKLGTVAVELNSRTVNTQGTAFIANSGSDVFYGKSNFDLVPQVDDTRAAPTSFGLGFGAAAGSILQPGNYVVTMNITAATPYPADFGSIYYTNPQVLIHEFVRQGTRSITMAIEIIGNAITAQVNHLFDIVVNRTAGLAVSVAFIAARALRKQIASITGTAQFKTIWTIEMNDQFRRDLVDPTYTQEYIAYSATQHQFEAISVSPDSKLGGLDVGGELLYQ